MLRDAREGSLLSMRLLCINKLVLILRRPRSGRLEGWAAIPNTTPDKKLENNPMHSRQVIDIIGVLKAL
jgi:hypothetical protein